MSPGPQDKVAALREIYFKATAATIERDFDRAIDILKSMPTEAERERAAVYMEGLAELRKELKPRGRRR